MTPDLLIAAEPFPNGVRICPIQSNENHQVPCQLSNCFAAYPVQTSTGTYWFCPIMDGNTPDVHGRDHVE
ncbi:MAG: hypothetical protein NTZ39_05340 [Methanoregula sp.]|nr:hypothetical protein [Methanoregula sp.]